MYMYGTIIEHLKIIVIAVILWVFMRMVFPVYDHTIILMQITISIFIWL